MFRSEAVDRKRDRLTGDVAIAVPVSWSTIGYLIFGGVVAGLLFLSFASFSRVEMATGTLTPDKGVSAIRPSRVGTVIELTVIDGDVVEAGELLARIRTEEDSGQGLNSAEQVERAIGLQDSSLTLQIDAAAAAALAQKSQLVAIQSGLRSEIEQIKAQISMQEGLISTARADYERAQVVAENGFVSERDLRIREESLLSRQQGLSQLQQALSAKHAALAESRRSSDLIAAQARAQAADLEGARAQIAQSAATAAGSRSYAIRAPIGGTVTAIAARVGQQADPQAPLMAIIPAGAELQAELAVPSSAIGFVSEGQKVSVAIDAFHYQHHGTIAGEILTVPSAALSERRPDGSIGSVYPVRVKLYADSIDAFGQSEALLSGMTCSARIVIEEESLLEWLFEPLYAVSRR